MARLVNIYFNEFHCGMLFVLMAIISTEQACTMYVVLQAIANQSVAKVPIPVSIWSGGLCLVLIATNMLMFGVAGSLHTLSMETLRLAKRRGKKFDMTTRNESEWKRILKAFPPVQIAIGMSNFIQKETPPKFFEYSIERFVDLLLLNHK
ncbi:unnamed protein product [Orchesella dallaii]|uniref:Uncharacterized protein n=1 Tax=Orchesella dallaii TaxID=48710 RepID=A0ABP1S6Z9_9HEXA